MERHLGQKIALFFAVLCYLTAVGFAVASLLYESSRPNDPVHASLMASVIFLSGSAIVLHVIARTRLKGLITLQDSENKRN